MDKNQMLRNIPKVDQLLQHERAARIDLPMPVLTELVRRCVNELRNGILDGSISDLPDREQIMDMIAT